MVATGLRRVLRGCSALIVMTGMAGAAEPPRVLLLGPGAIGPPPAAERIVPGPGLKTSDDVIDSCVQTAMARHDTPGAAVAVIDHGELIREAGYGVTRRDGGHAVGPETLFRIGSVTKQLTAAAVLQQVEAGRVSLADPVTRFVPELELAGHLSPDQLTVERLITHTTGYPDNFRNVDGDVDVGALSRWVLTQGTVRLHAPPGRFWNYSNPNFTLAGLVAERASGVPYRDYMQEEIFEPAGMTHTTFDPVAVEATGDWTWGYWDDPRTGLEHEERPTSYDNAAFGPAGYAFSTAGDLAHWALLLMDGGGDVLSAASAARMQEARVPIEQGYGIDYGFGVFRQRYRDLEVQQHGGNINGWGTMLLWLPERRAVVAVVANTLESLNDAAWCVVDNVFGATGPDVSPPPVDEARWDALVGRWSGRVSDGRLFLADTSRGSEGEMRMTLVPAIGGAPIDAELVPVFGDTFVVDLDEDGVYDLDFTFIVGQGNPGRVEWLVNRSLVFERVARPRPGSRE